MEINGLHKSRVLVEQMPVVKKLKVLLAFYDIDLALLKQ